MIRIFYDFRVTALILLGTLCAAVLLVSSNAIAAEEEHEEEVVHISTSLAQELGIETELAGAGVINRDLLLYGRTMPDPQGISHLSARYPGMIVSMVPSLGDSVEVGEVIAVIEANTSLQTYEIKAPLSGIVVEKHANPGELASGQPLLTIANYDNIWVDLAVFPGDSHQVRTGMSVTIRMDDRVAESAIRYINPSQGESPTVIARVPLQNVDSIWTPGLLVEGLVHVESENVAIAVKNDALHLFEDNQVVFVLEDETYEPRIVTVGSSDPFLTEILSGLKPGERYVVANSYLIKADLEKEGVEHGH
ncbi:MAG: HlyD family efflux transporter periplasmic adaptor subunit [Proteobacteria bacterium]|jgi:cobalt-zinc-cadmium efflux system membrane fusion protein|nr:HlyD family efflux transporter periplasmic adaptor subunit [Pseudomonadota bacterium]